MNIAEIEGLERRYQTLVGNYQAGRIDEATFISEVDRLQFQDNWGRYWMIGAQTGAWHYYDGQTWHRADPRDAEKLPFVDEQGRYWQRGIKSGDWYYYQPDIGEWVKPDRGESPVPLSIGEGSAGPANVPYQSRLYPQSVEVGPGTPSQPDSELFQDDEGRYWAVGKKTGQWYFYDHDGWHPAHEFRAGVAPQPLQSYPYQAQPPQSSPTYTSQPYQAQQPQSYQPPYSPQQDQAYPAQPYHQPQGPQTSQGYPSQSRYYAQQPAQDYVVPPPPGQPAPTAHPTQEQATLWGQEAPSSTAQPGQPQAKADTAARDVQTERSTEAGPSEPDIDGMPAPPGDTGKSGTWYYFDGKQWLKYSSGEPADFAPPDSERVVDQKKEERAKVKVESQKESVAAELFEEEDEPPPEIVDVEVITVFEAEPDEAPDATPTPEPAEEGASPWPPPGEDVRPRRGRRRVEDVEARPTPVEPRRQQRERTPSESGRPVAPRKREPAHEPTLIIPTDSAASNISSGRASRPVRPAQSQQRRAREDTVPMAPLAPASATGAATDRSHREVRRPMPQVASKTARPDSAQMSAAQSARQAARPSAGATPTTDSQAAAQPQKAGYTFGDVLRSFPSTIWTFVGGVIVLLVFAFIIIAAVSMLRGNNLGVSGLGVVLSPTPTLSAGPPDATPTPGPTPTIPPEPLVTSAPPATTAFSSATLGFSLEYPADWQKQEEPLYAIFSPSADGLDPGNLKGASMRIGKPDSEDSSIANLLANLLAGFPNDAEILNEGTISIASQSWTSTQIRFDDEDLGGEAIAALAVTTKDGEGYYLVAVAPTDQWSSTQPLFQGIINSFRFGVEETIAKASSTKTPAEQKDETAEKETISSTPGSAKATSIATGTPAAEATPITYVVQSGDTLLGIAVKFDVDVDLLASKNEIDNPNSLSVGQELVIPFTEEELAAYIASGGVPSNAETSGSGGAASEQTSAEAVATPAPQAPAASEAGEEQAAAPVSGKIAYPAFNPGTNNYDLWVYNLDTGEQTFIASEASQPAFSRDGKLLAYRSWGLATRGIFFSDLVGGRGGLVTRFVEDGLPTWSPDGFSFAFASRREGDRVPRIYRGDQLGQNDYSIGFQGEYPSTFPDGRLIVKGCLPSGDCGLFIIGANGGGETKISGEPADTAPAVSPDGSKIAFMSSGRGATNWEIWVMDADGSNAQRLTQNGSNEGLPAWSPDGQSIAYASDQGGVWAVWAMNADGSSQRKLFNMVGSPDGTVLHDKDNSKGWLEERLSWAP